jgi:hypothetical protein
MGYVVRPGHTMIHHIGVSQALDRVIAMTEGNQARRRDEAKHRKCRKGHGHAKPPPYAQRR